MHTKNIEKLFTFNVGDLLEIQRTGYYRFLFQYLEEQVSICKNPFTFSWFERKNKKHQNPFIFSEFHKQDSDENFEKNFEKDIDKLPPNFFDEFPPDAQELIEEFDTRVAKGETMAALRADVNVYTAYFSGNKITMFAPFSFTTSLSLRSTYFAKCYINVEEICLFKNLRTLFTKQFFPQIRKYFSKDTKAQWTSHVKVSIFFFNKVRKNMIKKKIKTQISKNFLTKFSCFQYPSLRKTKKIFFFNLPLITQDATFYINGCERVILSQIRKSPGPYFLNVEKEHRKRYEQKQYECKFLSDLGSNTFISININPINFTTFSTNSIESLPLLKTHTPFGKFISSENNLLTILPFFGISFEELASSINEFEFLLHSRLSIFQKTLVEKILKNKNIHFLGSIIPPKVNMKFPDSVTDFLYVVSFYLEVIKKKYYEIPRLNKTKKFRVTDSKRQESNSKQEILKPLSYSKNNDKDEDKDEYEENKQYAFIWFCMCGHTRFKLNNKRQLKNTRKQQLPIVPIEIQQVINKKVRNLLKNHEEKNKKIEELIHTRLHFENNRVHLNHNNENKANMFSLFKNSSFPLDNQILNLSEKSISSLPFKFYFKFYNLLKNYLDIFLNFESFSLGKRGRYRLNQKQEINLPLHFSTLTGFDFLMIINNILGLTTGKTHQDDIDNMKNKQIRSIGELLQSILYKKIIQKFFQNEDVSLEYSNNEYENEEDNDEYKDNEDYYDYENENEDEYYVNENEYDKCYEKLNSYYDNANDYNEYYGEYCDNEKVDN